MMRGIRGRDTQPEMRVRRRLHAAGLRYRTHAKDVPGRPDVVFRGIKTAVFVHGCFWHQHSGCGYAAMPKSNVPFWSAKLSANVMRDNQAIVSLKSLGWSAIIIWECEDDDVIQSVI